MKITMKRETTTEYAGGWKNVKYVGLPVGAEVTETLKDGTEVTFEVCLRRKDGARLQELSAGRAPHERRLDE